jgi:hypothetical protein
MESEKKWQACIEEKEYSRATNKKESGKIKWHLKLFLRGIEIHVQTTKTKKIISYCTLEKGKTTVVALWRIEIERKT